MSKYTLYAFIGVIGVAALIMVTSIIVTGGRIEGSVLTILTAMVVPTLAGLLALNSAERARGAAEQTSTDMHNGQMQKIVRRAIVEEKGTHNE